MSIVYKIFRLEKGTLTSCTVVGSLKIRYTHKGPWDCVFAFRDFKSAKAFLGEGEIIVRCHAEVALPVRYCPEFLHDKIVLGAWRMAARACLSKEQFLAAFPNTEVELSQTPEGTVLCWGLYLSLDKLFGKEGELVAVQPQSRS